MSTMSRHSEPIVLRMANAIARYIGFGEDEGSTPTPVSFANTPTVRRSSAVKPRLSVVEPEVKRARDSRLDRLKRHPQLREYRSSISEDVRKARHEAVRGLCAARAGAADVALKHFSIAAECEQVDLTAVPGFWGLTRGQMQLAVDAYEQVGRYRDGAALDAHIATIFRPSLVGANTQPVLPRENRDRAVNT